MDIETVSTCPLGSKCTEIKDNKLHRCAWYVQIAGTDPQSGENVDISRCSMSWLPILLIENANTSRSTTAAVESFRNETMDQSEQTKAILIASAQLTLKQGLINGS